MYAYKNPASDQFDERFWVIVEMEDVIHVYPRVGGHVLNDRLCWCNPILEYRSTLVVYHNEPKA